jgi:hypothetical protein
LLDRKLICELQEYMNRHMEKVLYSVCESRMYSTDIHPDAIPNMELEDFIKNKRKPAFNQILFSFIDKKGTSDSDIYKKAGIDRRHFSKIRSNPDYRPGKNTVVALALALELNKKEVDRLLSSAGYSLSDSDTFDLVVQFCFEKKIYDINDVNEALDYFSLKPLIGILE